MLCIALLFARVQNHASFVCEWNDIVIHGTGR
jgi:hypothetical protein